MGTQDFTTTITLDKTPKEVYDAINNVRGWWSEEIEGVTDVLGGEFVYTYEDVHRSHMKIVEMIPNEKIVWLVLDNYFNFTEDNSEWTNTKVVFDIEKKGDRTQLIFTHQGLVPAFECYEACRGGWTNYIEKSLRNLITTGTGLPNATGVPRTEHEKRLKAAK